MDFVAKAEVEIGGFKFEVRELTLAAREEIERAKAEGKEIVRETIRRCVYVNGKPLGDDAGNMGYSFATPLILKIQELSGDVAQMAADAAAVNPAAATAEPVEPGAPPVANGNGAAVVVPKA